MLGLRRNLVRMAEANTTGGPRCEVVELLYNLAMARASLDLPAQRRCRERLRGVDVRQAERVQADELARACMDALRPARECQREARQILLPHLVCAPPDDDTWSHLWASLSDAERARLLEIRDWLNEPIRSWLGGHAGEQAS